MVTTDVPATPSAIRAHDLRPSFSGDGGHAHASIEPFLRPGAAVDALGLATVLMLGYALGGRTVLAGVSSDEIAPDGFALDRPPSDGELIELTMDAVRRALPGTAPTVLLSGGRDSRLILLAMLRLGVRPRGILTLDQRGAESDAAVAERLARAMGERAERVRPLAFDGARELARHRFQSFQSLEHEWFMAVAERVRAAQGPVTDGIGAGVLSTGSLLDPEAVALWRRDDREGLFAWTAAHGAHVSQRFLEAARSEGIPLAAREEVVAEFACVLDGLRVTPNPLGMYSLLHWTRRGIGASAYGLLPRERVVTPLYDRALCRAVAALPLERAMARDWRETVLARLDTTGVPFSVREGGVLPRWLRSPLRAARSRLAWRAFVRALPAPLARLAAVAEGGQGMERTFDRGAVGLLAALDASTGFLSGGAGR